MKRNRTAQAKIAAAGEDKRRGGPYGCAPNDDPLAAYAADGLVAPSTSGKRVHKFRRRAP